MVSASASDCGSRVKVYGRAVMPSACISPCVSLLPAKVRPVPRSDKV
nr:hypothetical protein [Providencia stuartii]